MKTPLILGALPLPLYPFVALASVMSLAGETTGSEPLILLIVARGFQVTSLSYPIVYLGACIAAVSLRNKNDALAAKITWIPLAFFAVIILLFFAWMSSGQ